MWKKVAPAGLLVVLLIAAVVWRLSGHGTREHHEQEERAAVATAHAVKPPAAPASAAGKVTRKPDGAGVAGATVSLARAGLDLARMSGPGDPSPIATTDATGAWAVPSLPPGTYVVAAAAPGLLPAATPRIEIAPGEHKTGLDLALAAGGTSVHGTVADVGGGGIAGARITIGSTAQTGMMFGRPEYVALTGADGRYDVSLPDGEFSAHATHDDYTSAHKNISVAGKPLAVDFTLTPGGTIRGQVVARDTGKPVPLAQVSAAGGGRFFGGGKTAQCDGDGNFTLKSLRSGAIAITAVGRGYASAAPTTVELGIGEDVSGVRVMVDHAFSISGKVVQKGNAKQGIAGVMIGGFAMTAGMLAQALDPSAADGSFEIVGVKPASYMLFCLGEHQVPEIGKSVEVVDKDVTGVIVEMATGAKLSGRVDPPGIATITAEPGVEVGLGNMFEMLKTVFVRAESDATGAFVLEHVPAGPLVLHATTREGPAGKLPVAVTEADQNGLVIALETRASIAGRVIDTNHAPVAGTHINARPLENKPSMFGSDRQAATSDPDGQFKIVGLEPGKYRVGAGGLEDMLEPLAKKAKDPEIEVAAGEAKTGVTITVEARDGVIRGQVIGTDGKPAADAWVTAHGEAAEGKMGEIAAMIDFGGTPPVLTSDAGKFTIERLQKGTYKVVAEGARGAARAEQAGVKPGDSITLTMQPLGTLTGHLTSGGAPVASYDLTCKGPITRIDRHVDAADGGYLLEHLAPGSYDCNATADGGTAHGKVDVPPGAATLELQLVAWASITGTVVSALDGKPVPDIGVIASAPGVEGQQFASILSGNMPGTDAGGRFAIDKVPDGKGKVMLFPKTGAMQSLATQAYTAVAGQRTDIGAIKIIPPRKTDAGTFGMGTTADKDTLTVSSVAPNGPAAQAGIVVGDKITAIDGHPISDLTAAVASNLLSSGTIGIGVTVQLALDRGTTVNVTSVKW